MVRNYANKKLLINNFIARNFSNNLKFYCITKKLYRINLFIFIARSYIKKYFFIIIKLFIPKSYK